MPTSPELAEGLAQPVVEVYAEIERLLLAQIARYLSVGLDAPGWLENRLLEAQLLQQYAARTLVQATAAAVPEMTAATAKAWNRGVATADADLARTVRSGLRAAVPLRASLEAITNEAVNSLRPLSQRVLRSTADAYRDVTRKVAAQVLTGTITQRQAVQSSLNELADKGITGFVDRRGRRWGLDSYVEMASRTATARASVDGHLGRLAERGYTLVMVQDIPQECAVCRPYEGKVLSTDGRNLKPNGPALTTMDDARRNGLFHPGCRHATSLYQPGVTELPTVTADPDGDAARQHLRYLERRVRAAKRREVVAVDGPARTEARARVRAEQARIRDHVATTPAKRQPYREQLRAAQP